MVKLNKRYTRQVMGVFASTNSSDKELEEFYQDIKTLIKLENANYKIIWQTLKQKKTKTENIKTDNVSRYGLKLQNVKEKSIEQHLKQWKILLHDHLFKKQQKIDLNKVRQENKKQKNK